MEKAHNYFRIFFPEENKCFNYKKKKKKKRQESCSIKAKM